MDENHKGFSEDELRGAICSNEAEAKRILEDERKLNQLLEKAKKMINKIKNAPVISGLVDDMLTLFDLIRDYKKGNYRKIPLSVIVSAVVGVVYLVTPFDFVPDFIPVVGWLDDAAVFTFILNTGLALELHKYKKWKFVAKKDEFANELQREIKNSIKDRQLLAVFLTDDNILKLYISNAFDIKVIPFEVHTELIYFNYAQLKLICEELNINIMDVLDEIRLRFIKKDAENRICDIKVCRESDFMNFDETFEIINEED